MIQVHPKSPVPIFSQVKGEIARQITLGRLRAGEPLPSIRDLAAELIVNPNTVARAYRELEREGWVRTRQGQGTFVAEDAGAPPDRARDRRLDEAFDRAIGEALRRGLDEDAVRAAFEGRLQARLAARTAGEEKP